MNQLVQCYGTEWVKDVNKYGHYENTRPDTFQSQIFEGPDTDTETGKDAFEFISLFFLVFVLQLTSIYLCASLEIRLASARSATIEDDVASISGRPFSDSGSIKVPSCAHFIVSFFISHPLGPYFQCLVVFVCSTLGYLLSLLMNQLLTGKMKDL